MPHTCNKYGILLLRMVSIGQICLNNMPAFEGWADLLSVVITVYNARNYLDECLGSISNQSMPDFEAIVVDDGSNDGSEAICDKWKSRDERFRIFHTVNQGVSAARNYAIGLSRGDLLCFVDADDVLEPEHFESLLSAYDPEVLPVANYNHFTANKRTSCWKAMQEDALFPVSDLIDLLPTGLINPVWNKLYSIKTVKSQDLRFDESLSLGEDAVFNAHYLRCGIRSFHILTNPSYNHRIHSSESLGSRYQCSFPETMRTVYGAYAITAHDVGCPRSFISKLCRQYIDACIFGVESIYRNRNHMSSKSYVSELNRRRSDESVTRAVARVEGMLGLIERFRWWIVSKGPFQLEFILRKALKFFIGEAR